MNLGIVRLEHPTEILAPLPVPPVPVVSQPEGNRESAVDRDSQNFTENKRKMEQIAPIIQKPMNPAVSLNFIFRAEQVLWSFGITAGFKVFYKENEIESENPDNIERIHELENTSEEIRDCLEAGREGHKKLYVVTIDRIPNQAIGILIGSYTDDQETVKLYK